MRLDGPEYRQDCQAVFTLLYNCCNHERAAGRREALAWIEPHIETQDGRAAFHAFRDHFEGEGPTAMRRNQAFAQIRALHWRNEAAMTFAAFSSALKNAYDIVAQDAAYADEYKVRDLLEKIRPTSQVAQMEVVKGRVRDEFPTDFDKAIAYIASRIAEIYADDIEKLHRFGINKRNRQVYKAKTTGRGRNRGNRGGGGGRGNRNNGGRSNRSRGGMQVSNRQQILFNGIDASDPHRAFTSAEWEQLGPNGRAYVGRERERFSGRTGEGRGRIGSRGGRRGDGRGCFQAGRVVNEIVVDRRGTDSSTVTSRGGRSGSAFGIRAHSGGDNAAIPQE
jgi:hypothetical protein